VSYRTLADVDAGGMTVFCRVDFNVPLTGGAISDDRRIRAALPTIEHLASAGARVVCASHLGRPKGERKPGLGLRPVAARLGQLLDREVPLSADCIGEPASGLVSSLSPGGVGLLENLRFHRAETEGDPEFARQLAGAADLYVNDAFGAAHRAHASITGVPRVVGRAAAGFLMQRELESLSRLLSDARRPYVAILGGAKVSDKIPLIERLLERVDTILVGGAMAYTFLKARGVEVGASRVEADRVELAADLDARARARGVAIELPLDHVTAESIDGQRVGGLTTTDGVTISAGSMGVDIGPKTLSAWREILDERLETVLWNGPVGMFEADGCERGTSGLAERLAELPAFRVLGGGDTAAAVARFGLAERYDHVSTGGGAALEYLSGSELPGVASLEEHSS